MRTPNHKLLINISNEQMGRTHLRCDRNEKEQGIEKKKSSNNIKRDANKSLLTFWFYMQIYVVFFFTE